MALLSCPHPRAPAAPGRVCSHLLENADDDYYQRFLGDGMAYDIVCMQCKRDEDHLDDRLLSVCEDCFQRIETEALWDGVIGRPPIRERACGLSFAHEHVRLSRDACPEFLVIKPVEGMREPVFVAFARNGDLLCLDLAACLITTLAHVSWPDLDVNKPISLHLSPEGSLAVVANTRGRDAQVIDLSSGEPTMHLIRGSYHYGVSDFPLAFCELDGRLLLVHGTDWNRLDISDPHSGVMLTDRSLTAPLQGQKYPEHALDYFHGSLSVSPGGAWIVDNGWIWQPFGVPVVWNLRRWLHDNVWESEDGLTRRELAEQYDWDLPCCWLDGQTVALWGYQSRWEPAFDAVRLYDVASGRMLRSFAGPSGELVFDGYLYSYSQQPGTSVWDVETGERLLHDETLRPACYHRGAGCFLSQTADGEFQISRLQGRKSSATP